MLSYKVSLVDCDDRVIKHNEVMGHVIGNGALKVQTGDGTEYIYNGFKFFKTVLSADEKKQFREMIEEKEASALAKIAEQEKGKQPDTANKLEVVPSH